MNENKSLKALKSCFLSTIPVMTGYVFLGITYGILMRVASFPVWLPIVTAIVIYTGSLEFLMVEILASAFHPLSTLATSLMVGARHIFYGIAMLNKYGKLDWKKYYLIFSTVDETFALNYAAEIDDGIDKGWYYFWVSLLDQIYWIIGTCIGAICGGFITIDITGLDFVMTAMFVVILASQWEKDGNNFNTLFKDHISEIVGLASSVVCLIIFGPNNFIVPTLIMILVILLVFRKQIEKTLQGRANNI